VSCVGVFDDIKCTLLIHKKKRSSAINVQKIKDKEANKYKSNILKNLEQITNLAHLRLFFLKMKDFCLKKVSDFILLFKKL
jgi:hypothetical protein